MLQAEAMVGDFPEELVDYAREGERQEATKRLAWCHHCDRKCPKTKLRNTVGSFSSVHVLHLLKSDPIGSFIFLLFTERKIKVENRALVLISGPQSPRGNGLGPRRAPHFQ